MLRLPGVVHPPSREGRLCVDFDDFFGDDVESMSGAIAVDVAVTIGELGLPGLGGGFPGLEERRKDGLGFLVVVVHDVHQVVRVHDFRDRPARL